VSCCGGESAVATLKLAIIPRHSGDAPALAPTARRSPLDVPESERPPADR
jgi:hypothetical protein